MHPAVARLLEVPQIEQRTPLWYEARRTLITASDAASIIGIKPFAAYKGNPRDECMTKKLENKPFSNIYVRHGNRYEDEARDLMCEVLGETTIDFGLVRHPTLEWLGASPDGVTLSGRAVEIKAPLRRKIVPGHVPCHYFPQIQIQMEVLGLDSCIFVQFKPASLNDGVRFIDIVVIDRDRLWFETHKESLYSFWVEYMSKQKTYVPLPPAPQPLCLIQDNLYASSTTSS